MKKRSLVLVTVDCLRADHVGFHGYKLPVTPFLDSLAKGSAVFSDAVVAGVPTYFSFPSILASRYPLALGREVVGLAPNETTIATWLRDAGFCTAAFVAGNPYLTSRYGYDQGFQTFQDFLHARPQEQTTAISAQNSGMTALNRRLASLARMTGRTQAAYDELYFWYCQWRASRENIAADALRPYPDAQTMVDRACSWLRENGEDNFFLWIHLMDAHHPHYPPQQALSALGISQMTTARQRFLNSFWNRREIGENRLKPYVSEIVSLYDASIRWVDQQIANLVRVLQELGRWDETIFVLTADHGEEFLEHGARYHSPLRPVESLLHVPLIIRSPGISPLRTQQGPFSLIHLAPTLLEGLGVSLPGSFEGRSHWPQITEGRVDGEPAIVETVGTGTGNPRDRDQQMRTRTLTVRGRRFKLVLRFGAGKDEMFDLENDPPERTSLPESASVEERLQLLNIALHHLRKTRLNRDNNLVLAARIREIQSSLAHEASQSL